MGRRTPRREPISPISELPEGLWSLEHAPKPGELRVDREAPPSGDGPNLSLVEE